MKSLFRLFLWVIWAKLSWAQPVDLRLDGAVCGMTFEKALSSGLSGEFNRSPGGDGGASYDDLTRPLHIRTDSSGRIVQVRGSQLRLDGKVIAQVGQKSRLSTSTYQTAFGKVRCRVGRSQGRLQALQLEWVGATSSR